MDKAIICPAVFGCVSLCMRIAIACRLYSDTSHLCICSRQKFRWLLSQ